MKTVYAKNIIVEYQTIVINKPYVLREDKEVIYQGFYKDCKDKRDQLGKPHLGIFCNPLYNRRKETYKIIKDYNVK